MKSKINLLYISLFIISVSPVVFAHEPETLFNQVYLQAQSEREIPNDQMVVVMATEHEGTEASGLADKINKDMQWAQDILGQHDYIKIKTKNYQTYPVYNKQVIIGWRASQQIELTSENIKDLSDLVGKLQERLFVKQMQFSPTDTTRKKNEDELIEEALMEFKSRIALVKKHMDNKSYRIISININSGSYEPPIALESRAMMQSVEQPMSPKVQAGTSKITVTVSGSVQFF